MIDPPLNPTYAASIAPAKITPCSGATEEDIREILASAWKLALRVQSRLGRFDQEPGETSRAALWNAGPEATWFMTYDRRKLNSLTRVFRRIPEILTSRRLKVIAHAEQPDSFGDAWPAIFKIHIWAGWIATTRREKIQTFVHEASHIAGRYVGDENPWYGEQEAQTEAAKIRPHRPRMMMRSAENLGWYAIDLAENSLNYT